jgi:hypothetical protein
MTVSFDIFRMGQDGEVSWVEMAATLKDARDRVESYSGRYPAVYFILSHPNGDLEIIDFAATQRVPQSDSPGNWAVN